MFTLGYEDAQKSAGHMLVIHAMHTKTATGLADSVEFFSYLEGYSETFSSNWQNEDAFGRMDGISSYTNTKRSIQLSFRVPAASESQAKLNLYKISKLVRFLYPAIDQSNTFGTIKTAPILRVKFANLIQDANSRAGLFGYINGGLTWTPVREAGFFTPIREVKIPDEISALLGTVAPILSTVKSVISPAEVKRDASIQNDIYSTILPKIIDVQFTFTPLHNHLLGQSNVEDVGGYRFAQEHFPYGFNSKEFEDVSQDFTDNPMAVPSRELQTQATQYDMLNSYQKQAVSQNYGINSVVRKGFITKMETTLLGEE